MNFEKQRIHIHQNYKNQSQAILHCITHFNSTGESLIVGERNVIKCFNLPNLNITIKSFKKPNAFNAFVYKYIRNSKAKRSYKNAEILIAKHITTPCPIAYIETYNAFGLTHSYYVCAYIAYDFDFRDLIHNPLFPERTFILEQFAAFTFKLHKAHINFLDHSPGNTLIVKKDTNYQFYLIDLNRMRFENLTFKKRMFNFRRLWLSKTMLKTMAEVYAKLHDKTYAETYALMYKYSRAFQRNSTIKKLQKSKRKMQFKNDKPK